MRARLSSLHEDQQKLMPHYLAKIAKAAVRAINQRLFDGFISDKLGMLDLPTVPFPVSDLDLRTCRASCGKWWRDWSDEGRKREGCLLQTAAALLAGRVTPCERSMAASVVPGGALAASPTNIAQLGFTTQGNEFSLYMLFASDYFLIAQPTSCEIFPYACPFQPAQRRRPAPARWWCHDHLPRAPTAEFSMTAGDFLEVYAERTRPGTWWSAASPRHGQDIVDYVQTISRILSNGGLCLTSVSPHYPLLY